MELSILSLLNNWKNRKDEFKQSLVRPKEEYINLLRLGDAVGERDLEQRYETLLSLLANYGLVDIPDATLNRIVELIKQIWKRQPMLGMSAGIAYIYSLVDDLRLIRARNDADLLFGDSADGVLIYCLLDILSKKRFESGKIFSAIQKYDWKIKIGPLVIALAQHLPPNRLEELLQYAITNNLVSDKDLADVYLTIYRRTQDIKYLKSAFKASMDVDEEKALQSFDELLVKSENLGSLYDEIIAKMKTPIRFKLLLKLLAEVLKREDTALARRILLDKEGNVLTVKQAQALGRELGAKFPKKSLEILRELPGENGLYGLLGILSGTKNLDVAIAAMEEILKRLETYTGDTMALLKQLVAVSLKLDIWDELILSVPEDAPWLGDFENLMSDALKVIQSSADTEVRLQNLDTPVARLILNRMKSGGPREVEWFDPTWFSDED
ncbi:hypothetical protein [Coprothermobacter platensis]|uniref:hypothetical protein n=1 Tax=Coprothermobacter platensis TaxID=108819 RepID=UPI0003A15B06|nr:hypothetical protein [Coprothermobacter platensis]